MAKVLFVHFGAAEPEIGIQFDADDGAGGTVIGRTFAPADPTLKQAVLDAAQAALDAAVGELPADYPAASLTTALMRKRTAEAEAKAAREAKAAADEAAKHAETRKAAADREVAAKAAEAAALDEQIAKKRAELAATEATPEPLPA